MSDTLESETARVADAARRYGVTLPDVPFSDDTPEIVRPAANLFAALVAKLTPYGIDPMPLLADARHGAMLAALERSSSAVVVALREGALVAPPVIEEIRIVAGDVELDALRRVEGVLAELVDEVEREVRKQALKVSEQELSGVERAVRDGGHNGQPRRRR